MRELIIGKLIFLAFNAAAIAGLSALLFGSGLRRLTTTTGHAYPDEFVAMPDPGDPGPLGPVMSPVSRERSLQTVSVEVDPATRVIGFVLLALLVLLFVGQTTILVDTIHWATEVPIWSER